MPSYRATPYEFKQPRTETPVYPEVEHLSDGTLRVRGDCPLCKKYIVITAPKPKPHHLEDQIKAVAVAFWRKGMTPASVRISGMDWLRVNSWPSYSGTTLRTVTGGVMRDEVLDFMPICRLKIIPDKTLEEGEYLVEDANNV